MKLRNQLLLISLLTLLIPWAGSLFIQELEQTLRHNQLNNLSQHARLIAEQLADSTSEQHAQQGSDYRPLYAFKLPAPIILDGYFDDWRALYQPLIAIEEPSNGRFSTRYLAGIHGDRFYLFIEVETPLTRYRNPTRRALTNSDHLQLKLAMPQGEIADIIASPIAPGPLDLLHRNGTRSVIKDTALRGYWQDTRNGYQIELEIPLSRVQRGIGFAVVQPPHPDHNDGTPSSNSDTASWSGITPPEEYQALPPIVHRQPFLESQLEPYQRDHTRISVINPDKWVVAEVGQTDEEHYVSPWQQGEYNSLAREILLSLFKAVLGAQQPAETETLSQPGQRENNAIRNALAQQPSTDWFHDPASDQAIIAAAYPIPSLPVSEQDQANRGVVLVEQTTDAIASLSDRAMVKLVAISFSVVVLIVVVLLGFASSLSWRVTRLRNQIEASVSEEGRMGHFFTPSTANDELGDLSRSFAAMHNEVASYTEYLENFSRKLSHELKTPLAIVRSSIENLSLNEHSDEVITYLQRADEGTQRLSQILHAMSEASRLEKSIENTEKERFDLTSVVLGTGEAFQGLLKYHQLSLDIEPKVKKIVGSPDLIAQLLDKLIENARDFTPEHGNISISLDNKGDQYRLQVSNEGPLLPVAMQHEIFNSFVSVRSDNQKEGHMGQGLVIVKLITDYHQGKVSAYNREDKRGVCFEVLLPKG